MSRYRKQQLESEQQGPSTKLLKVALGDQAFYISLADIELAVLCQVDGSVTELALFSTLGDDPKSSP